MLARVKELNGTIFGIKRQCWTIEAALLELEKKLVELEKACPKKFEFPKVKPALDFKNKKIEELNDRLKILEKHSPQQAASLKQIRAEFNQHKEQYERLQDLLEANVKQLEKYNKDTLCKNIEKVSEEIHKLPPKESLEALGGLDGSVSLLLVLRLLAKIEEINNQDFISYFSAATKIKIDSVKNLFDAKKGEVPSFDGLFAKATETEKDKGDGKTIKPYFEEFTKKTAQEITDKNLDPVTEQIFNDCWAALEKKWKVGIKDNTAYNNMRACIRTSLYLSFYKEAFRFTNEVQSKGTFAGIGSAITGGEVGQFLKMTLDQVRNPYRSLPLLAKKISTQNDATHDLFFQLCLLVKGMHDRCHSQIPPYFKSDDGTVLDGALHYLGDDDDRKLAKHKYDDKTHEFLVKWSLAQFHSPHLKALLTVVPKEVLARLQEILPELKEPAAVSSAPVAAVTNVVDTTTTVPAAAASHSTATSVSPPVQSPPSVFSLPSAPVLFAAAHAQTHTASPAANITDDDTKPPLYRERLVELKRRADDAKPTILIGFLDKYTLNPGQIDQIERRVPGFLNIMQGYKGVWFKPSGWPNIFGRAHASEVNTAIKGINANKLDPVDELRSFLQLAISLNGTGSTDILPKVLKEINAVIEVLEQFADSEPRANVAPPASPAVRKQT